MATTWIALHWRPAVIDERADGAVGTNGSSSSSSGSDGNGSAASTDGAAPRLLAAVALGYTPSVAWAPAGAAWGHDAGARGQRRRGPADAAASDALLLDVHACLRLWGGAAALLARLADAAQATVDARRTVLTLAAAPTGLGALALARCLPAPATPCGRDSINDDDDAGARRPATLLAVDGPSQLAARLDALPLPALGAAALGGHAPTLARLGCRTLGDLRRLPRGGLARRYGPALLDTLDAAYGLRREAYAWIEPAERFDETIELPSHAESAEALGFAGQRLLQAAHGWLAARQAGTRQLHFAWRCEAPRRAAEADAQPSQPNALELRSAQPARDLAHWQRLLRERLARCTLAAPATHLRLAIEAIEPLAPVNATFLPSPKDFKRNALQFLEHAEARFGSAAVRCAQLHDEHRAARQTGWQPAAGAAAAPAPARAPRAAATATSGGAAMAPAGAATPLPRPPWLVEPPLALAGDEPDGWPMYQGRLRLLAGPERIDCGWWDDPAASPTDAGRRPSAAATGDPMPLRDYYLAESPHAGLLWIFLRRGGDPLGPRWFLHGLYG